METPLSPAMFFDMDGRMMLRRINSANLLLILNVLVLAGMFVLLGFVYRSDQQILGNCACLLGSSSSSSIAAVSNVTVAPTPTP